MAAETFAARLRSCRRKAGLSQKKVAYLTGISRKQLSEYERGHVPQPGWTNIGRIKRALGCTWDDLLPGE